MWDTAPNSEIYGLISTAHTLVSCAIWGALGCLWYLLGDVNHGRCVLRPVLRHLKLCCLSACGQPLTITARDCETSSLNKNLLSPKQNVGTAGMIHLLQLWYPLPFEVLCSIPKMHLKLEKNAIGLTENLWPSGAAAGYQTGFNESTEMALGASYYTPELKP